MNEEQKSIRSEAASHKCVICDEAATNWVEIAYRKYYFCDRHENWQTLTLEAKIAAWQEEHPGKSFWDGAFADSGLET